MLQVWGHCSEVILSLLQPVELVQCIKYGGELYFTWKLPHLFSCTSLPPTLAPGIVDLMIILWFPEEYLSLEFLKRTTLLNFSNNLIQIYLDFSWYMVGMYCPLGWFYFMVLPLRFLIPHKYIFFRRIFKEKSFVKSSIC